MTLIELSKREWRMSRDMLRLAEEYGTADDVADALEWHQYARTQLLREIGAGRARRAAAVKAVSP